MTRSPHRSGPPRSSIAWLLAAASSLALLVAPLPAAAETSHAALLAPAELTPPSYLAPERGYAARWRGVRLGEPSREAIQRGDVPLALELFDGAVVVAEPRRTIRNPSGSVSWIGDVRGQLPGPVVLVHRDGVTLGSIRTGNELYMLSHAGAPDRALHVLYEVDEASPAFREAPPTEGRVPAEKLAAAEVRAERMAGGDLAQDDGSLHDLMVVYSPAAEAEVGGTVAMENLIDLGVTETNLSYEASGVNHRVRLVHTALTDYDEDGALGDPRDLLQGKNDGVMDEVHAVRDRVAADLVKLILSTAASNCGRAFIMDDLSIAFEEFAFCWTKQICVSPRYSFQHELGHLQSGRHERFVPVPESPFAFNFGYRDATNQFRTIMAAGSSSDHCPEGCPRRLAWSNPDLLDEATGAPMGTPETEPLPTDMRKALNTTGWIVANFRVSDAAIFFDGFETGDTTLWTGAP